MIHVVGPFLHVVCLFALVLITGVLFPAALRAADSSAVVIDVADRQGNHNSVRIGVHARATNGFDQELGERPIPPVPTVPAFDIRITDPLRQKGRYAGLDAYTDFRAYRSEAQADTFVIRFQPTLDYYPVTFRWRSEEVARMFQAATLAHRKDNAFVEHDMIKTDSIAVGEEVGNKVIIVLRGPFLMAP